MRLTAGRASSVLVAATLTAILLVSGTPCLALFQYLAAFVWIVLLPGMLIHRALRGPGDNVISDLAFGAATGFILNSTAFVLLGMGGLQWVIVAWPAPLIAVFAAVPGLRHHFRLVNYPSRIGRVSSWLLAIAALWQFTIQGVVFFANAALPPLRTHWFPDDYYHLGISAELVRSVPPTMAHVAGRELLYYWLPHADRTAMHLASGVDLPVITERLWYPVITLVVLGLIFAVGQRLGFGAWAALLSSLAVSVQPLMHTFGGKNAFALYTLTLLFSLVFMLLAIDSTVLGFRTPRGRAGWINLCLFAASMLGLAGSKISGIPVIVCGLSLAGVIALVARRDLLVQIGSRIALAVAAVIITAPWFFDANEGTPIRAFNQVTGLPYWAAFVGKSKAGPDWLPVGSGAPGALWVLALLVLLSLIALGVALPGLRVLNLRHPESFFLLGIGVSGWVAMMSIDHYGGSQNYFLMGAMPALYLLSAWGFSVIWRDAAVRLERNPRLVSTWVGLGATVIWASKSVEQLLGSGTLAGLFCGLGVFAGLSVGLAVALRRFERPVALALGSAAIFGACAPAILWGWAPTGFLWLSTFGTVAAVWVLTVAFGKRRLVDWFLPTFCALLAVACIAGTAIRVASDNLDRPQTLSQDEVSAALWLRENTKLTDVVATNIHCLDRKTVRKCPAIAYWVSGLGERRVLLEGWGYTVQSQANHGVNGLPGIRQPFDDPHLFALNESAFYDPSAAIFDELRAKGVRWLFADAAAGPISPKLAGLAAAAYESESVVIYRI